MNFNKHFDLVGEHAFLSGSKYHWINYDEEKIIDSYNKYLAIQKGNELHDFACQCIILGQKLPKNHKALNMYVNDAIGFRMTPEQPLFYSNNAFGTCDAICYREKFLRIHDLKTGISPVSIHQLEVYASLFCLEYDVSPLDINMELRIYQTDNVLVHIPPSEDIIRIIDKIILFDKKIEKLKLED
jgi:hypothetical protein